MVQKQLVFATGNRHKVQEVRSILSEKFLILSLEDIGCHEEIPETKPTLEGNALQKAHYVKNKFGLDCFSEDTGLEIEALNGEPGVLSARYAGGDKTANANIDLVLQKMEGIINRKARFRTVIALLINNEEHLFDGVVEGQIETLRLGVGGFGYDPIFTPTGYKNTFGELSSEVKNKISHRAKAVEKLVQFLADHQTAL